MCISKFVPGSMAAALINHDPDAPGLGYGMFGGGAGLPHDVYQRDLAHGIDHNTPGVSVFAVAFGCAYDQLVERAVAEFAAGGHTLH